MLAHVAQNNFTAGELSEWLDPRVDFPKYNNGLSVCENAIVRPQGGVFGRGGTVHVAACKYADRTTRLIPFRFSKTQAYMIELGDLYFRVYYNYAPVTNVATISAVFNGPAGQISLSTVSPHGFSTGNTVTVQGVISAPEANGTWAIEVPGGSTLTLLGSSYVHNATLEGTVAATVEGVTGYAAADLRGVKYTQTGDTLYLVHEDYPPAKIVRLGHASWSLQVIDFVDGPYFDKNTSATTIDPSTNAVGPGATMIASSAIWVTGHIGSIWRYSNDGTNWGYFEITGFTSGTQVTATILTTLPGGANPPASTHWREGMWSDYQGYPAAVTMYEQSSVWGGSPGAPQTFAKSVSDSPEDMTPGTLDDDAATFTVGSGEIDAIRWMKGIDNLVIGTEGSELSVSGNSDSALTPTSIRVKPRTPHGSNHIDAVRVSDAVVFCQRTGKRLRALSYQIQVDKYVAKDLGILADHILQDYGLVEMAYQQERHGVLWGIREDGMLIGLTYLAEEEVLAWHRHPTYGDGAFQSVASIPSPLFDRDDVYVICRRTINGEPYQGIEYVEPNNPGLDCAVQYAGPVTSITIPHLKNTQVSIVAGGVVYPPKTTDSAGTLSFSAPVSNLRVGLPFTGKIVTMKPEQQLQGGGTTQGLPRRWVQTRVRVLDTLGLTIAGEQIPYRKSSDLMDTPVAPFTGDHIVRGATSFDEDGRITVEQTLPLSWAVTAIFGKVEFGVD